MKFSSQNNKTDDIKLNEKSQKSEDTARDDAFDWGEEDGVLTWNN